MRFRHGMLVLRPEPDQKKEQSLVGWRREHGGMRWFYVVMPGLRRLEFRLQAVGVLERRVHAVRSMPLKGRISSRLKPGLRTLNKTA